MFFFFCLLYGCGNKSSGLSAVQQAVENGHCGGCATAESAGCTVCSWKARGAEELSFITWTGVCYVFLSSAFITDVPHHIQQGCFSPLHVKTEFQLRFSAEKCCAAAPSAAMVVHYVLRAGGSWPRVCVLYLCCCRWADGRSPLGWFDLVSFGFLERQLSAALPLLKENHGKMLVLLRTLSQEPQPGCPGWHRVPFGPVPEGRAVSAFATSRHREFRSSFGKSPRSQTSPRVAPSPLTPHRPPLANAWLVRAQFCVSICRQGTGASGFAGHGFTEPSPGAGFSPVPSILPMSRSRPRVIPCVSQPLAELAQGENELWFCQARPKLIPVPLVAHPVALMSLVRADRGGCRIDISCMCLPRCL